MLHAPLYWTHTPILSVRRPPLALLYRTHTPWMYGRLLIPVAVAKLLTMLEPQTLKWYLSRQPIYMLNSVIFGDC